MSIDHIFIFTDDKGKIADDLVQFGWTEGSSRIHGGQGTTNRKFYFDNFFLEILWVHNEEEFTSEKTMSMGLWQRAAYKTSGYSPFGLCLVNTDDTDPIFKDAFPYQPEYFPSGMEIEILKNETHPDLPWIFRLPFKGQKKHQNEPTAHKNGTTVLTNAVFEIESESENSFLKYFKNQDQIQFKESPNQWLNLIFDKGKQGKKQVFEKLRLTIIY